MINMAVPTGVISYSSTVAEAFSECLRCNVEGIPFVDSADRIIGQFSVHDTVKTFCRLNNIIITEADMLEDYIGGLELQENDAAKMLSQPVERYILSEVVTIHSASPCVKAMALMEKHDTGIVNVQAIAKRMMQVNRPR